MKFGSSVSALTARDFTFRIMSVISSLIPEMYASSCGAPSILIATGAAPGNVPNKILLKQLPRVVPKPLSSGSITNSVVFASISLDSILVFFLSTFFIFFFLIDLMITVTYLYIIIIYSKIQ